MNKEQVKEMALGVAMRFHLSDFDQDKTSTLAYAMLVDDYDNGDITVWEPFEDWSIDSVYDSIWNLANDIEQTVTNALGLK
jgi:hypothetical protein